MYWIFSTELKNCRHWVVNTVSYASSVFLSVPLFQSFLANCQLDTALLSLSDHDPGSQPSGNKILIHVAHCQRGWIDLNDLVPQLELFYFGVILRRMWCIIEHVALLLSYVSFGITIIRRLNRRKSNVESWRFQHIWSERILGNYHLPLSLISYTYRNNSSMSCWIEKYT